MSLEWKNDEVMDDKSGDDDIFSVLFHVTYQSLNEVLETTWTRR